MALSISPYYLTWRFFYRPSQPGKPDGKPIGLFRLAMSFPLLDELELLFKLYKAGSLLGNRPRFWTPRTGPGPQNCQAGRSRLQAVREVRFQRACLVSKDRYINRQDAPT